MYHVKELIEFKPFKYNKQQILSTYIMTRHPPQLEQNPRSVGKSFLSSPMIPQNIPSTNNATNPRKAAVRPSPRYSLKESYLT